MADAQNWHSSIRQRAHYWQAPTAASATVTDFGCLAMITQDHRFTNASISIELSMETSGNPEFIYGGQGTWNHGTAPANVRLFFATVPGYNLRMAAKHEDRYWWSASYADVATLTNCVLSENLSGHWSNASGHRASDRPAQFQNAREHIRQIGVSFGGGSFYDVGIKTAAGQASIHLQLSAPETNVQNLLSDRRR